VVRLTTNSLTIGYFFEFFVVLAKDPFIEGSTHSSIHPFIHSSIHPFIHSSIHPFIHSSIHPPIHPGVPMAGRGLPRRDVLELSRTPPASLTRTNPLHSHLVQTGPDLSPQRPEQHSIRVSGQINRGNIAGVALPQCVSRDTSQRTRQPRAACLARFRTSSSLEAERRPDRNDTARERGSVGSTGAPCPARVGGGGLARQRQAQSKSGSAPSIDTSTHRHIDTSTHRHIDTSTHRHIDISYTTCASQYTKSHRPSRTHRHGTARAPPFPLCTPRVPPVTRKDSVTALAYYPTLSPSQRPQQLHQSQRPHSTPLTSPPRRHGHLNP
jgi:hypothetical protein